jgi:hypothetical protein
MKVALFSDVITWIGEGHINADKPPDVIVFDNSCDPNAPLGWYSNLALQGGSSVIGSHDIEASYVQTSDTDGRVPGATLYDVKIYDKPISTQGA